MKGFVRALIVVAVGIGSPLSQAQPEELVLRGEAIEGGLIYGRTLPGSVVRQDGEKIRVGPQGHFLLGFHRDAPKSSSVHVMLPDGTTIERSLTVQDREYRIQKIDGLPSNRVTPRKPEELKRIRKDIVDAKKARSRDDDRQDFLDGFDWPLVGPITGVYGSQRILNGKPRRPHYGVDVAVPVGTPVKAPADGVVTLAVPDMFFSGGTMIIDHGHKLTSSFLHLHKLHAKVGDRVTRGEVVAEVGATGRVTGPHLDWRMNLRDLRIDPQLLAPPMPVADNK